MRALLLLLTVSAYATAFGQVEMVSLYFNDSGMELTGHSQQQLHNIVCVSESQYLQVIEVNSFHPAGVPHSEKQASQVIEKLSSSSAEATINGYGSQRIPVNFQPINWTRVDVYYSLKGPRPVENPVIEEVVEVTLEPEPVMENVRTIEPKPKQIARDSQYGIRLNIQFKEGTSKMIKSSEPALQVLCDTLNNSPDLNVHIRGHVCCGHNQRISRNRARAVYKSLKKSGICPTRLTFAGYSNRIPLITPEKTHHDREKNRRVDIIFE